MVTSGQSICLSTPQGNVGITLADFAACRTSVARVLRTAGTCKRRR